MGEGILSFVPPPPSSEGEMKKEIVLLTALLLVAVPLIMATSSDGADGDSAPTVTIGNENLEVKSTGSNNEYYLIDVSTGSGDNFSKYATDDDKDTFTNYKILTRSDYNGKDLKITIPSSTTLYLINVTKQDHYGVNFNDSLNSITISGEGNLDAAPQAPGNICQRYIGFNGVSTTIDGIEITDIVMLYGGSIANDDVKLSSTNLFIRSLSATDFTQNDDKNTYIVAGSRFSDVGVTNLNIESLTVSDGINVSVFGGCHNTFQTRDSCGSVDETNVVVNGGSYLAIYGGSFQGLYSDGWENKVPKDSICRETNVTVGPNVTVKNVYGGGYLDVSSGNTNVLVQGATVTENVYGGGLRSGAETTNVTFISGNARDVYGGSRTSGIVGDTAMTISGGSINSIYGGNYRGTGSTEDSTRNVSIMVTGGSISGNVYGGGCRSGSEDVIISVIGYVTFDTDSVIYGGSCYNGEVSSVEITVKDVPWIHSIYGGSLGNTEFPGGKTGSARIVVDNSYVRQSYGGGYYSTTGTTETIYKSGSTVQNHIFGGGYGAPVTSTHIVVEEGVSVAHSVYGGGHYSSTDDVVIDILGGDIGRGVLAGGRDDNSSNPENKGLSSVGDAVINVYGGNIGQTGDKDRGVFAGGGSDDENGKVTGRVSINILGGNVYAVTLSDANVKDPIPPKETPEVEISGGKFNTPIESEWLADGVDFTYDSEGNMVITESRPPTSWDDEELPPFIPPQDSGDDTVTIVACAAAAAVAAIMAVFLIIDRKR